MPELNLDLTACHQHLVRVRISHRPRQGRLVFSLPIWTPGSYLIRDYVRQLEGLEVRQGAEGGAVLPLRRLTPSSWQLELTSLEPIEISYTLLAAELTVRTCHLNGEHGFLALAAVALEVEGERWSCHRLQLNLPPSWQAFVPLAEDPGGGWLAQNFDQLVDTPIEVGPHRCHYFSVDGVPHRWVSWGPVLEGCELVESDPHWLKQLESVCLACCRLMGVDRPAAAHYLFVLHLSDAGYGGLEHDLSTVLQFGRRALARPEGRRKLLQLAAHEYLHQWNVRRLRPAELTPYRYDQAVVVPSLWFAEGITSYVDQLLPLSAGCCTEAEVIEDLGADLSRYLLSPGRRIQSLRASSEEAWVKLYRPDAYSANSQISYYLKGAVLALVLDLHLRRAGSCLPLVLRELWSSHGAVGRGYREADLIAAFARHAPDLAELLPTWLASDGDPPLATYLVDVGLALKVTLGASQELGCRLDSGTGAPCTGGVQRDGPAARAGLTVGDEWLALDGIRLRTPEDALAMVRAGDPPRARQLLFSRDGLVRTTTLTPDPAAPVAWSILLDPDGTETMAQQRRRWLTLEAP